jgi:penicillin-binding protein 1C
VLLGVAGAALVGLAALVATPYPAERLSLRAWQSTRVLDRDGRLVWERPGAGSGYARFVPLDALPRSVVLATLAGEDQRFREHIGIDPVGVARALWLDARLGRFAYGGSTLTQQLAKLLDRQPRTLAGKLVEAVDALRLERTLTKDEILAQYLTRAYYGRNAYGIEAAAQRFYGKPAKSLALDEAALLAILPRAPSAYDPDRHPERARARRARILRRLVRRGELDAASAEHAANAPIRTIPRPRTALPAPHFVDALIITDALPEGAPEVRTSIDLALQARLEARVRAHLLRVAGRGVSQAGVVVVDVETGEVRAMVGSRRYGERAVQGAVNATTAARHPGSTLKPFVYALALTDGAHPGTPVFDVPTTWRGYAPRALDGRYRGVVSLRDALGSSLNVPATRLAAQLGPDRLARTLHAAGLRTIDARPGRYGLSLALGGARTRLVDLAEAYATLARGGVHRPTRLVLPESEAPTPRDETRVLDARAAYLTTQILADAGARRRTFGLETPLELPFPVAVKTGTSQGHQDDVVVGYTPEVVVAVWAGNFDGAPTHEVLAMEGAAPLFREAVRAAVESLHADGASPDFVRPVGIVAREVCPLSGLLRGPTCPHARLEEMNAAHVPAERCTWHRADGLALPAEVSGWHPGAAPLPASALPAARLPAAMPSLAMASAAALASAARPTARGTRRIEIVGPADGARLRLDPLLPRSAQAAHLRVAVRDPHVTHVRWEIDGALLADARAPFDASLPLTPGTHRVRAVLPDGERDELLLHVDDGDPR